MKKAFQKLAAHPLIRKSALYYYVQRYRQYRKLKVDPGLTSRPDIIESLLKDGIYIQENFIDSATCNKIIEELKPTSEAILQGTYTEGVSLGQIEQKAFRIGAADTHSPTAKNLFFENPLIQEIAKAYVSEEAVSYRREADYKTEAGHLLQADLPHFDDWRHRFKAFLYLTDVSDETAPFVYYKGSHVQASWKKPYHMEFERNGIKGRYGHFFVQEMKALAEEHSFEELKCTAKAGTLIFADFRGIHKGTTLQSGKRILLNNTFGIKLDGLL